MQGAYDEYEPNDDLFSAGEITIGEQVMANLLDSHDRDHYHFTLANPAAAVIMWPSPRWAAVGITS